MAAGRELRVEAVIEGSVQRVGEQIRVTVQLVSVRDGAPLWAEKFDEHFTNIFAVQDRISESTSSNSYSDLFAGIHVTNLPQGTEQFHNR